jgi:hypothetical protein
MSERNPGEITGYSVALVSGPADQLAAARAGDGAPLFFSGGKLAADLSLPKLRTRRAGETVPLGDLRLGRADRRSLWQNALASVASAERHVRGHTMSGRYDGAADAASGTMDVLVSAANALERGRMGPLRRAANRYERAAREQRGSGAARTSHGDMLRLSAVAIGGLGSPRASEAHQAIALVRNLQRLVDAICVMRAAQQREGQARAAVLARSELGNVGRSQRSSERFNGTARGATKSESSRARSVEIRIGPGDTSRRR